MHGSAVEYVISASTPRYYLLFSFQYMCPSGTYVGFVLTFKWHSKDCFHQSIIMSSYARFSFPVFFP